jgi:hypothetical protein
MAFFNLIGSFPDKGLERFGPLYFPPHQKQKMNKNDIPVPVGDSKMCQLGVYYDADIHDALGNLRKLDGNIAVHLSLECLLIFSPPRDSVSTEQRPLLLNWGTSFSTFCIFLIMVIILIIDVN